MSEPGPAALEAAQQHRDDIVAFLREMIAIPAESLQEGERCERILAEYRRLGFDAAWFDALGNVVARVGNGPLKILMDGHLDCVGVGDPGTWEFDPFAGKLEDGKIFGRGAVDELPAVACMAYGLKILMDRGLPDGVTVYLSASVMEEDCDGHCLLHLIGTEGIKPDVVVIGEPTDLGVYRGQRGRVEATITTRGKSAHAAHAEQGINAVYKMARIVAEVETLNSRLAHDEFLGTGSVVVSSIECTTPSLNAVPDSARITIDRRLTAGETVDIALEQLRTLPSIDDAEVELLQYEETSWRGYPARQDKYFPTWVLEEDHALVQGLAAAVEAVTGAAPRISRWGFSTNGVASMGRFGIPTAGFAPGLEELAHTTDEWVAIDDLVSAAAVYSLVPEILAARADELVNND